MPKVLSENDLVLINEIKSAGNIPEHIAIIMDGNGRWAELKNKPRAAGHKKGVETVRVMVQACINLGVKYLTLYTFSTENWKRPQKEISILMRLMVKSLRNETNELNENNVRITSIGNTESLPKIVQKELKQAKQVTKNNNKLVLNLAVSYSGRWEIIEAAKKIALQYSNKEISVDDINEELISKNLTTKEMPDPDLMIRSGGEKRISNFLIWQIAYAELYVSETLWPDFNCKNLIEAIEDYQKRERRFGLISKQISKSRKNNENLSDQLA
ncbi:MAG: di-trans,poly-cis-decaprenylcistransferase [Ignavibacteriae bacterium]|nr:MAG: di-trans,poly-cis-decaprenylcistransferase [Ignavibacteriota bacterium]